MKRLKRATILTLCLLVMGLCWSIGAQAAKAPEFPKTMNFVYESDPQAGNEVGLMITNCPANAVVKNLKSSNKKVAVVKWYKNSNDLIDIQFKKPGKANISFDLVWGKNKKHFTSKLTIGKYACPVAVIKVGGKNYASSYKAKSQTTIKRKGANKFKISVTAKAGWKLEWLEFNNGKTMKRIKNNSTVTCGKDFNYFNVYFSNNKTHNIQCIFVHLEK